MSYTALYRKFRPITFDDVKGQDHIVKTLQNQLRADRIGHAYLFCGTRGTGKTTVAKIFARAVNCEHPVDGSPCGECECCQSILKGISMNVIEIDAASNNGVDNVREIIEQVTYPPTEGRFKVFIIDEVHMLSTAAFNALLKTLEEPPEYVIFILATTEANKIPITVHSRCQQYDFHRITTDTIKDRMRELLEIEGGKVTEDALSYIAKKADGSMRDALSLLDQCMAFYMNQEVNLDNVLEVLGAVDQDVFARLIENIEKKDAGAVLDEINQVVMQGRELGQFILDFIWYMRNLLLIKNTTQLEDILDMSSETIEEARRIGQDLSSNKIIRYIRVLSELSQNIKYANQKRVLVEVAMIKLCRPQMEPNLDALIDRINDIEVVLSQGKRVSELESKGPEAVKEALATAAKPSLSRAQMPKAVPEDIKTVTKNFRSWISEIPSGLDRSVLSGAKLNLSGDKLQIVFSDDIGYGFYCEGGRVDQLKNIIEERLGKEVQIEVAYNDTGRPYEESFVDLEKVINMELTIEEDDEDFDE